MELLTAIECLLQGKKITNEHLAPNYLGLNNKGDIVDTTGKMANIELGNIDTNWTVLSEPIKLTMEEKYIISIHIMSIMFFKPNCYITINKCNDNESVSLKIFVSSENEKDNFERIVPLKKDTLFKKLPYGMQFSLKELGME